MGNIPATDDAKPIRDYSIAIVGGGIGGLCTAIGLLQQGVEVDIYEGAGVSLGPNALRALKQIDPRAYEGFLKIRTVNPSPEREFFWFSFRTGDDLNGPRFGTHFHDQYCETGQASVHRACFLEQLVALVPEGIAHFGKKLANITDEGNSIILHFLDGSTAMHSAVIGCDGIKSVTREVLFGKYNPDTAPTFSGKYAYRGLIPMEQAVSVLGDELARNSQMYLGHGGHILTFSSEHGKTLNVVAFRTKKDNTWKEAEWVRPMDKEAMFKDFEGWIDPCQQILSLMQKPDIWALFDHPPIPTYFRNRICLLGDAAHSSTPHNGAGAGQAVEDALIMAQASSRIHDGRDIPKAFEVYDRIRRPRSQRQVTDARFTGLVYDMEAPGIGDNLVRIREKISTSKDWIWNWQPETDVQEVQKLFEAAPNVGSI